MSYISYDVAVCESCYFALYHGVGSGDIAHDTTTGLAPLELIPADYDITDMSYSPLDDGYTVFSKLPCDGCGSLLAGSRWALVVSEITV